jgi:hypothetical protein
MVSVRNLAPVLTTLLSTTADELARQHGVIQRVRAFTGASLCQTLVFGYLDDPHASLSQLCQAAATCQVQVSRQAIDQRLDDAMGERIGNWLEDLLQRAVRKVVSGEPSLVPLLARFGAIWVEDATVLTLPDALAERWPGCGGSTGASGAALKLSVRLNLATGEQQGPRLAPGRVHDRLLAEQHAPLEPGSLYLADLAYFSLPWFAKLVAAGVQVLSRLRASTQIIDAAGKVWDAAAFLEAQGTDRVDVAVQLGVKARFACRLLAARVPAAVAAERRRRLRAEAKREGRTPGKAVLAQAGWTVLLTTVAADQLSLAEAFALLHARWQIELLWKGWKTDAGLRTSRSTRPAHIRAELSAKLLGLVVQGWVLLTMPYRPLEDSRVLATTAIRAGARWLAAAVWRGRGITAALRLIAQSFPRSARIAHRRRRPSTAQILHTPELACLN